MDYSTGKWETMKFSTQNVICCKYKNLSQKEGIQESQSKGRYPEYTDNGALKLSTLDNKSIKDLVNGSKLETYDKRNKLASNYFISREEEQVRKAKSESDKVEKLNQVFIKRQSHKISPYLTER